MRSAFSFSPPPLLLAVVFADDCKVGANPFSAMLGPLQEAGALPAKWRVVAATPTYNPLGTALTFTSTEDILAAVKALLA